MSTVLFVTGTGTEVGKTVVTAAVAGIAPGRVAVVKPGQTGVAPDEPGDLAEIARLTGRQFTALELARYPEPLAPDTAARRSGLPYLSPAAVASAVASLAADHDLVLVEGAGGLLVRYDEHGHTLADMATATAALGVPVAFLLVTTAGLGTLNSTALTAEALAARNLPLTGLVIGSWPAAPDLASRCNLSDLPTVADAPLLGALPAGAAGKPGEPFRTLAAASLAPALGGTWTEASLG
ncbi:dethiobiotin synthase [Kitasatospora sp. NPDC002227]|uniref:dethiobiotin synthase n=1 Tax=Kitasatospora sp. NPDC002227 TaxID=3154773 RepID=UPI00331F8BC0